MNCLTENEVMAFVARAQTPAARAEAERHLDTCRDCLSLVAANARFNFDSTEASTDAVQHAGSEAPTQIVESPVPKQMLVLSRYILREPLGMGGMGMVYAAHDPQLDRRVAVKLLRADGEDSVPLEHRAELLVREARALAQLSHPNVVAVHDVGIHEGQAFVAMELVEGRTLNQWLDQAPRALDEVLDVVVQAGHGLSAAHQAGLVHRDFKPGNVLVGDDGRVRVTDFGLARPHSTVEARSRNEVEHSPTASTMAGTPAYMAPEQFRGMLASPASDQFAFSVTLYESLDGHRPKESAHPNQAKRLGRPAIGIPPWLEPVLKRGLSIAPRDRFDSLKTMLEAIEQAQPAKSSVTLPPLRPKRWAWRAAIAFVAVAAAIVWIASAREPVVAPVPFKQVSAAPAPPPPPPVQTETAMIEETAPLPAPPTDVAPQPVRRPKRLTAAPKVRTRTSEPTREPPKAGNTPPNEFEPIDPFRKKTP